MKFLMQCLFGLIAAFASFFARAATDTTAITGAITDAGTAAGVVGAAVLVMVVGIKVYKWIRTAL